jgi:galactokinase
VIAPEPLIAEFERLYQRRPSLYRAPGRVNLIGEHTDYTDGFVMPAAVDRHTWVAIAPRRGRAVRVRSADYASSAVFDLDAPPALGPGWLAYVRGMAAVLERGGHRLCGADLLIRTDVPIGGGLGSSAALEIAAGFALLDASGIAVDLTALALAAQQAEHEFAGTRCGIMDQFISARGRAGHALLIDTRTLGFELLPVPPGAAIVVCDTKVRHELATDGYNDRRAECETGVRAIRARSPGVASLRDATMQDLAALDGSPVIQRRCRHVISENARVLEAAAALERGDLQRFGRLMGESHRSLRDDYEVSCAELNLMVELASSVDGAYGTRMTGGGFGGCTVSLVRRDRVEAFCERIARGYEAGTGRVPALYVCAAARGVERVD